MRFFLLILGILFCSQVVSAKIYKWVDENGTVHFSDHPYSDDAKEVEIHETGIKLHKKDSEKNINDMQQAPPAPTNIKKKATSGNKSIENNNDNDDEDIINEDDYKINATVGELGADVISISGRIGRGPKCDNLVVVATAKSDTGLSATITDQVRKTNSYGSVVFQGAAKASGSADDLGFWDVESVKITCEDQ